MIASISQSLYASLLEHPTANQSPAHCSSIVAPQTIACCVNNTFWGPLALVTPHSLTNLGKL